MSGTLSVKCERLNEISAELGSFAEAQAYSYVETAGGSMLIAAQIYMMQVADGTRPRDEARRQYLEDAANMFDKLVIGTDAERCHRS